MSGSSPAERRLSEQHLGDRLSALVDGELGHESRERVLAHLATCARCKAEADAQRQLKNVFAEAAPPSPSESFLARLQGLPAGGDDTDGGSPFGGGGIPGTAPGRFGGGVFGLRRGERFELGYVPARAHTAAPDADHGFPVHDVGHREPERPASRGLRIAFAAAGAVSLAAIALGGVTGGSPADTADARGGNGTGSNVTPMRSPGTGNATAPESQRRRGTGPVLAQGQRTLGDTTAAPTQVSAPLLPGIPSPAGSGQTQQAAPPLTGPVMAGAAVMSPLIRPLTGVAPPLTLTSWSTAPEVRSPGMLAAPAPDTSSASPSPSRTAR
ncbi:zf-HC2 domain-containing protein [Streptomyces sp. NPDC020490]|uniref:zf-HC2 domain-containing protein n=1 Tax=Streptomyces sp. NPDC020490 TaxID=3365078 RepID=UPI0037998B7F